MIKKFAILCIFAMLIFNCKEQLQDADAIINKSIEISGGQFIKNSTIEFDFRDKHYKAIRNNGIFLLNRSFKKDTDTIVDILSNDGLKRMINDNIAKLADSMIPRYSASVNSVHYFSVLPYGLNGKAVNKAYLGQIKIKEKDYHKIKITFNEEGGGEDFEDAFIYWINTQTFKADYIAYSYNEDDGLGLRFREAYNERFVNGIRFVDYNNYKPESDMKALLKLDELFQNNKLELLSKIELKSITTHLIDN